MNETKLIKATASLLTSLPISTEVCDWDLPKYISNKVRNDIQCKLDKLDSFLKNVAYEINQARKDRAEEIGGLTSESTRPARLSQEAAPPCPGVCDNCLYWKEILDVYRCKRCMSLDSRKEFIPVTARTTRAGK
jgi:hypothetical protein